jgi:hypothetical protein
VPDQFWCPPGPSLTQWIVNCAQCPDSYHPTCVKQDAKERCICGVNPHYPTSAILSTYELVQNWGLKKVMDKQLRTFQIWLPYFQNSQGSRHEIGAHRPCGACRAWGWFYAISCTPASNQLSFLFCKKPNHFNHQNHITCYSDVVLFCFVHLAMLTLY